MSGNGRSSPSSVIITGDSVEQLAWTSAASLNWWSGFDWVVVSLLSLKRYFKIYFHRENVGVF